MIDAPLALAFTAGMVASINPCGFALLPAYVAAFVAGDHAASSGHRRVLRAVGVSGAVSVGFAITFVLVGVVFGLNYALVSLSCALGPFLAVTGFAMSRSTLGGIVTYLTYASGMGVIILALSVSAVAQESLVGSMRSLSRYAPRIAGGLLVISGSYAVWFGRHELRVYDGDLRQDRFVELGMNLQTRFVVVAQSIGSLRIGLAIVAVTLLAYTVLRLRSRPIAVTTPAESDRKELLIRNEHKEHT